MAMVDDITSLIKRINAEFDDWSNFFEHTRTVWRTFELWVNGGHKLNAQNDATGHQYTEEDLVSLSQYYTTEYLAPFALQRYIAIFEAFFFDFLRILLRNSPGSLGKKELTLGELLAKGSIPAVVDEAIDERLNKIRYARPTDWFQYIDSLIKLGCPSNDEIASLAEIKVSRDVIEHNAEIVNKIYLDKAGEKSRFKEGEALEVPDSYLRQSWGLLKKICNDMCAAAIKIQSIKK